MSIQRNAQGEPIWDRKSLELLKRATAKAKSLGYETFPFEGQTLDLQFAQYLIMHLNNVLPKTTENPGQDPGSQARQA